jgi:hypothetical protein
MSRDYRAIVQVYGVQRDELCFTKHFLMAVDLGEVSHVYKGPKKLYTIQGVGWILLTAGRSPANYADSLITNIQEGLSREVRVRVEMRLVQYSDIEIFDTEKADELPTHHPDGCSCALCKSCRDTLSQV